MATTDRRISEPGKRLHALRNVFNACLSVLLPNICHTCGEKIETQNSPLCLKCRAAIVLTKPPFCTKCGRQMETDTPELCGECAQRRRHFDSARSACVYDAVLKECLHKFKYNGDLAFSRLFSDLICEFADSNIDFDWADFLVPVPLYHAKERERSFNQSEYLAKALSHRFNVNVLTGNLYRIRPGTPQAQLSHKEERMRNPEGAFMVKVPEQFKGSYVILIDDVFTTGATADECARILKQAGARKVDVLTLARGA